MNISLITTRAYSDNSVQSDHTYSCVTTAVDNQGRESGYSNQATAVMGRVSYHDWFADRL